MNELGFGFTYGTNKITKLRVIKWLHVEDINFEAFLWYITDFFTVTNFDKDSFDVEIFTVKQREFFYKIVMEYDNQTCVHNYNVAKKNELWITHKRNASKNIKILKILESTK